MFRSLAKKAGAPLLAVCLLSLLMYGSFAFARPVYAESLVSIDGATRYQSIDGFGFSEAFGRANSMASLASPALQQQMLDLLFNDKSGAGFTILRNIISSYP